MSEHIGTVRGMPKDQCRTVLHIDWEADNAQGYIREDVARCGFAQGHAGQHMDSEGLYRW